MLIVGTGCVANLVALLASCVVVQACFFNHVSFSFYGTIKLDSLLIANPSQFLLRPRVSVVVMPISPCNVTPDLVIVFRILQYLHINVHDAHPFGTAPQFRQRSDKRYRHL